MPVLQDIIISRIIFWRHHCEVTFVVKLWTLVQFVLLKWPIVPVHPRDKS